MKLHNTLTRKLENFEPLKDNTARIYSCGPTVYDHAHIGNLSAYVFADTLRRALRFSGFQTRHVMNYTDVDDKTIRRSREQFSEADAHVALTLLTDKYTRIFMEDMQKIGNDTSAITFVSATNRIEGMKQLIVDLHAAGFAYIADDGIYFSIEAYRKQGKKYGQLLELTQANTSAARIQNDEYDKESAHDFAIWKTQKEGEPAWEFEIDGHNLTGRPGWHIECSVMSKQELGQPFDIHTGGIDLIFPHHENEIAQSTALTDNPMMAQFFTHNDHMLVDGKKMSKSLQNFYTLEDVVQKGFDPLAFRIKILQSHYRNSVNFTWESLEAAQNLLHSLRAWADLKHQPHALQQNKIGDTYAAALKNIQVAIADDLNTSLALAEFATLANQSESHGIDADKIQNILNIADQLFGLRLAGRPNISDTQKEILGLRDNARHAKNWAKSDELRGQLKEQGITVRDTPMGQVWARLS